MEKSKGIYLVVASLVFSIGLIVAAYLVSSAINNAGQHISNAGVILSNSVNNLNGLEDYELIVNDGWLYLHDKVNGQVWKKPDNPEDSWEMVEHFTEEIQK